MSLRSERGTKSPLNMLKEGSVMPDSTASAREANKPSSVDYGPNKRGEDNYLHIQALPRAIERGKCTMRYGEETRERRQKQIFKHIISEIAAATPNPYTWKRPSVNCTVSYTHTHRASMQIYSLPLPIHPLPNTHTHCDTCNTI